MHVFYAAHGEPKNGGVRENEASLAKWISRQRNNKKKGLNPELCARVEREFPWWKWKVLPTRNKTPDTNSSDDYFSMTSSALKDILRDRGLAVGGTKTKLIERLMQSDASLGVNEEEPEQADFTGSDELPHKPDEDADNDLASGKTNIFLIIYFYKLTILNSDESGMSSDDESVVIASAEEYEGLSDTDEEVEDSDSEEDFAPPSKRPRDDGLDQLSKEELLERLRKKPVRGYTAPNPLEKDQINALFSDSLPLSAGVVYFLDHTDFKTAHAMDVEPSAMVIPQNDRAAYEQMRRHPRFGGSVVFGDFNEVLRAEARPVRGIYADFTGPVQCGLDLVAACAGNVQLAPAAVVAVTITLRNPAGNDSYVNAAVEELSSAMSEGLGLVSLRDERGDRVKPIYYGAGAPMVTLLKRKA
jgi:hypothetical protein